MVHSLHASVQSCRRLSSLRQKNDFVSPVASMEQFRLAHGLAVDGWINEIDGGMYLRRKKFGGKPVRFGAVYAVIADTYPALADEAHRQAAERRVQP